MSPFTFLPSIFFNQVVFDFYRLFTAFSGKIFNASYNTPSGNLKKLEIAGDNVSGDWTCRARLLEVK